VAEARADLADTVGQVAKIAESRGAGVMCSGTHPITDWETQEITGDERYLELIERNQWLARQLQIFGVHVHCGIRAPQKAIPIVNALLGYLPHFLALSASSPYWIGSHTGLASYRSKVFEALPTAGLPYQLSGWDEFETYMDLLVSSHAIETIREVWWDIRPHPNFGTVELRICDGLPSLDEISCVAALAQCLVERFDHQLDDGYTLPEPRPWVVRENKWRAARYGLDAEIVADNTGRLQPVAESIVELVEDLLPVANRLECLNELEAIPRLITRGASYQRQQAVAAAHDGALEPVVDLLLTEMRDGLNL
jgi:carboxylate-amine ligase